VGAALGAAPGAVPPPLWYAALGAVPPLMWHAALPGAVPPLFWPYWWR
jgi:hypothetical protein